MVYDELHRIASRAMRRERADHTLQPTALVHEAYVRLVRGDDVAWQDRAHFLGIAAHVMRQVLVDHARKKHAARRGGHAARVTLTEGGLGRPDDAPELLDLHHALERFAAIDERAARVAELRLFAGATVPETAEALGVSKRTVDMDWAAARMWLTRELAG
jgi:RNA polymerase sigma factor (TIGR02999 family)